MNELCKFTDNLTQKYNNPEFNSLIGYPDFGVSCTSSVCRSIQQHGRCFFLSYFIAVTTHSEHVTGIADVALIVMLVDM